MANGNGEKPKLTVEERLELLEREVARIKRESADSWMVEGGFDARMEKLMADHREWLHQHDLAIIRERRERRRLRKQMREMDERLGERIDQVSQHIKQVNEDLGKRISDMASSIGALISEMRSGHQ